MVSDLFRTRDIVAFSALSNRQLFRGHSGYCNYDTYSLVVQRYRPGQPGTFAFTTRRRDGGTNQLWSSDEFAFRRPDHIDPHARFNIDRNLTSRLLSMDASSPFIEAIREFNWANTDSSNVPEHVEIVMMKSAFEWLLNIGEQAYQFVVALTECLKGLLPEKVGDGPLKDHWKLARPKATRPLEAWAREFCDLRGAAAHGTSRMADRFVWKSHIHLAFASLFFPLLLKKKLADARVLAIDEYDVERLRRIEDYLLYDPFSIDWDAEDFSHPWVDIDSTALIYARSRHLYDSLEKP